MSRNSDAFFETRLAEAWIESCEGRSEAALAMAKALRVDAEQACAPRAVARANHHISWFCAQLGRAAEGLDAILAARTAWAQIGDTIEIARTAATYAWVLMELGDSENAISEASDALIVAERIGDPAILALACNTHSLALTYAGQLDSGIPLMERAVELGKQVGDPHALARWYINLAYLQACVGDRYKDNGDMDGHRQAYERARATNDTAIGIAERARSAWCLRVGLANGAEYHGVLGALEVADTYLKRWEQVDGASGDRVYIQYYYTQSELLNRAGRVEEARALCERAVERAAASGITLHELNAVRRLSEVYETGKDYEQALALYKRYHLLYKKFSGETTQRRARITQAMMETEKFKSMIDQANRRADQMAADALLDPLTGIANRRALDRELSVREAESHVPYALAIVDLDHFKAINDVHSHMTGDDVLRVVADTLAGIVRPGDLVSRMGGEEFAVVLPGATADAAESVCERFRLRLAKVDWQTLAPGLVVTASIGLAASTEAASAREVLALADTRLYAAKSAGRNRVIGQRGAGTILVH